MAALTLQRLRRLPLNRATPFALHPGFHPAAKALEMATFTLQRMAAGGMRDQLGGGFARYSVDEWWHVPHFEASAEPVDSVPSTLHA